MSVTIEIDDETAAEIDRKAKATGQSRAGVVEQAMRTHSASSEKKELPRSRPLPNGQTLAEAMGDFVGCFSNEAMQSEDISKSFGEYLDEKHRTGHL